MANENITVISKSYLDRNTITSKTDFDAVSAIGKYADAKLLKDLFEGKLNVIEVTPDEEVWGEFDTFSDVSAIYDYIRLIMNNGERGYLFDVLNGLENCLGLAKCDNGENYLFISNTPEYESFIDPNRGVRRQKQNYLYDGKLVVKKILPMRPMGRMRYYYNDSSFLIKIVVSSDDSKITLRTESDFDVSYPHSTSGTFRNALERENTAALQAINVETVNRSGYNELIITKLRFWGGNFYVRINTPNRFFIVETLHPQVFFVNNGAQKIINVFTRPIDINGVHINPTIQIRDLRASDCEYLTTSPYIKIVPGRLDENRFNTSPYLYDATVETSKFLTRATEIGENVYIPRKLEEIPIIGTACVFHDTPAHAHKYYELRVKKRHSLLRYIRNHIINYTIINNTIIFKDKPHFWGNWYSYDILIRFFRKDSASAVASALLTQPIHDRISSVNLSSFFTDEVLGLYHTGEYRIEVSCSNAPAKEGIVLTKPTKKRSVKWRKLTHDNIVWLIDNYGLSNRHFLNLGKTFMVKLYFKHKGIKSERGVILYCNKKYNFISGF